MSTPASRQRQRQRRRANMKLYEATRALAGRRVDFVAYERVIHDMPRSGLLPPSAWGHVLAHVAACRDAVGRDCTRLLEEVAALEKAAKALSPK